MVATVATATEPSNIIVKYQGKKYYMHRVENGDTLYSIAKVYGVSLEVIMEVNGLEDSSLQAGKALYVPVEDTKPKGQKPLKSASKDEHIVRPGETLYSLSRTYGLTEEELLAMNGLESYTDIKAGMRLKVKADVVDKQASVEKPDDSVVADKRNGNVSSRSDNDGVMYSGNDSGSDVVADDTTATEEPSIAEADEPRDGEDVVLPFVPISPNEVLRVTLLLPFHANGEAKESIVDFYRGALIAMEDLKNKGRTIELTVLDSKSSAERIFELMLYGELNADLIIGPVYEKEFAPVLRYAESRNIPVVSPLVNVAYSSPVLFNMPPPANLKSAPFEELFDDGREVVTIYASKNDADFIKEMSAVEGYTPTMRLNFCFDRGSYFYKRNADGMNGAEVNIEDLMRTRTPKIFVITAASATDVDRILTTLSSTRSSIRGRGMTYGDYMVVGSREWLKMGSIDRDIFFHNNVHFVVPYYSNRIEESVRLFDGRYAMSFGDVPSRNAYRGYDAAIIFCNAMFEGFDKLLNQTITPLVTPYRFEYRDGSYQNTKWVHEHYRNDSTIVVE